MSVNWLQPNPFVAATQAPAHRGTFRIKGHTIVVYDDDQLLVDEDYAPGVNDALREAWEAGDYFVVMVVDDDGNVIDSIGSMAGYGSPKKAAEAFVEDYL